GPADEVGRAARPLRHDELDRPRGPVLRRRGREPGQDSQDQRQQHDRAQPPMSHIPLLKSPRLDAGSAHAGTATPNMAAALRPMILSLSASAMPGAARTNSIGFHSPTG